MSSEKGFVKEKESSLELLWTTAAKEIDAWNERESYREESFLKSLELSTETVKRRQKNIEEVVDQVMNEINDWGKRSREDILSSTSVWQYFFPVKSYEEINTVLDDIQRKTTEISTSPLRPYTNNKSVEVFMESVQKYVEIRRKNREQITETLKDAGKMIHQNQREAIQLYTRQVKNLFFPFQKYMEMTNEMILKPTKKDSKEREANDGQENV